MSNPHENWEVEVSFRVTGRGRVGADGLVSFICLADRACLWTVRKVWTYLCPAQLPAGDYPFCYSGPTSIYQSVDITRRAGYVTAFNQWTASGQTAVEMRGPDVGGDELARLSITAHRPEVQIGFHCNAALSAASPSRLDCL